MSEPIASPPTGDVPPDEEAEMLQFDQAEYATPPAERPTCTVCHQPIAEEYYEISQKVLCPRCRYGVEASFRSGSGVARFLKATVFGIGGAAIGAVFYYGFVRATGANWAWISIIVGIIVGSAVRKGTGNRGGRVYQLLAVFLTYTSIVTMNVPLLIEHMNDGGAARRAVEKDAREKAAKPPGAAVDGNKAIPPQGARDKDANPPRLSSLILQLSVILLSMIGLLYAIPVLEATASPIAGLIYAFALWEAWKINKPVRLVFSGPFRLSAAGAANVKPEGVADEL